MAADTLRELQRGERIVPRRLRTRVPTLARRLGEAIEPRTLDRDGDDLGILAMRELLSGRERRVKTEDKALGAGRLAAQTNAVAVLGMIKNLQNEIQVKYLLQVVLRKICQNSQGIGDCLSGTFSCVTIPTPTRSHH